MSAENMKFFKNSKKLIMIKNMFFQNNNFYMNRISNNTDYLMVLQIYNNLNKFTSFQQTGFTL